MKKVLSALFLFFVSQYAFSQTATSNISGVSKRETISSSLQDVVTHVFNDKILTYKPSVNVVLVPSAKTLQLIGQHNSGKSYVNYESKSSFINKNCVTQIILDDEGNVPYFTEQSSLYNITLFNNEQQKRMAQEFVTLHEAYHCEFHTLKNIISFKEVNSQEQEKFSFIMKEAMSEPSIHKISYVDLLAENFADTAAALAMMKIYGSDNKDLLHTLNSIRKMRYAEYLTYDADTHFSHFSLLNAFSHDLKTIDNQASFDNLALAISSVGAAKALTNKPFLAKAVFDNGTLMTDIYLNLVQIVINRSITQENVKQFVITNPWDTGIARGYSYIMAEEVASGEDFKKMKFYSDDGQEGENHSQLYDYVSQLLKNKKPNLVRSNAYIQYSNKIDDFKHIVINDQYLLKNEQVEKNLNVQEAVKRIESY